MTGKYQDNIPPTCCGVGGTGHTGRLVSIGFQCPCHRRGSMIKGVGGETAIDNFTAGRHT